MASGTGGEFDFQVAGSLLGNGKLDPGHGRIGILLWQCVDPVKVGVGGLGGMGRVFSKLVSREILSGDFDRFETPTWYLPGTAPSLEGNALSSNRPEESVSALAGYWSGGTGAKTTDAPSTGSPSSVTTPVAGTVSGRFFVHLSSEEQPTRLTMRTGAAVSSR